jgi:hypothetical protein
VKSKAVKAKYVSVTEAFAPCSVSSEAAAETQLMISALLTLSMSYSEGESPEPKP